MGKKKNKKVQRSNLELSFFCRDLARELTIREYLGILLLTLWQEGEGFSGKRPFGNSCWQYDLYKALVAGKVTVGEIDDDEGDLLDVDIVSARAEIQRLILELTGLEITP